MTVMGVAEKEHSGWTEEAGWRSFRLINDLSRPHGTSVNDCSEVEKYRFASVSDAYGLMVPKGYMAKVDFAEAYRSVPLHSRLWRYFVWEWQGTAMMDTRPMFGHKAGPGLFTELSQAVVRKMKGAGCPGTIGYLDDILVVADTQAECQHCYDSLVELVQFLGFKVNPKKLTPPTQDILYLGIRLQTNADGDGACRSSIDEERVQRVSALCTRVARQQFIKRKDLEGLMGLLNFCAQVVYGARLYMRSGYALQSYMRRNKLHRTGVTRALRADLLFWTSFLVLFMNGKAMDGVRRVVSTDFFAVDASTSIGMGGQL